MAQDTTGDTTDSQRPADISDENFARQLLWRRKTAGLTQEQLAERMTLAGNAMHRSAIAKIEAGDRSVSVGEAGQFAAVLHVSVTQLLKGPTSDAEQEQRNSELRAAQALVVSLGREVEKRHKAISDAEAALASVERSYREARHRLDQAKAEHWRYR